MATLEERQNNLRNAMIVGISHLSALVCLIADKTTPDLEKFATTLRGHKFGSHRFGHKTALGRFECVAFVSILDVPRREVAVTIHFTGQSASLGNLTCVFLGMLAVSFCAFDVQAIKQTSNTPALKGKEFVVEMRL